MTPFEYNTVVKIPIVILHGWNGRAERWVPVQKLLEEKDFSVYVPQLPGFVSDTERPWNLEDYVHWLLSQLNRLKLKRVILLCHSNGGRIGMKFSAQYPNHVEKLILVNSAGIRTATSLKRNLLKRFAKLGKRIANIPLAKKIFYAFIGEHDYEKASPILKKTLINILEEDLTPIFSRIQTKTTIIWGTKDQLTPPSSALTLHHAIPQSKLLWIEGAKHGLPFTHSKELVQLVETELK